MLGLISFSVILFCLGMFESVCFGSIDFVQSGSVGLDSAWCGLVWSVSIVPTLARLVLLCLV